ncbi:MAG: UDP-N-acetylglucosamine 2-epimerase (hydrolyzing) [Rhodospirillaceae bacterium]|nr:UDP-N-acetylglucosamine 2-epimerase (hydrolyzing) [Rhodospirillaceae bacterium]
MRTKPMRICAVTGSRADYGLLQPVMAELRDDGEFDLSVVATGTHLAPEFGLTYREIEADGFAIDSRVEIVTPDDTGIGVAKSMGLALSGLADAFAALKPDFVLLLGDRFEALAAAETALVMGLPLIHFSGGDVTEGSFDDAMRHAITKMASLHFVASADAGRRVRQLGEDAARVHVVGDPGLDALRCMTLMCRDELENDLGFRFRERNFLITFHPATLDMVPSLDQFAALLEALAEYDVCGLIFTKPNADPEGRALTAALDAFVARQENAVAVASLGHRRYLSVMNEVDVVVGNSSSGLLEAPSLHTPAVNIGDRQGGRLRAASVIDCAPDRRAIGAALNAALELDCKDIENPYGDGYTAARVLCILKEIADPGALLHKKFVDLPSAGDAFHV